MVILVLLAPDINRLQAELGSNIATIAGWIVGGLAVAAILSYTRLGLRFISHEQKPL